MLWAKWLLHDCFFGVLDKKVETLLMSTVVVSERILSELPWKVRI
jgi:hypothetical protein